MDIKCITSITVIIMLLISGCGNISDSPEGVVKTGGSSSVEKVMNALIYQFQYDNREITVNYEMNGSGDGIKNTISGMYDIGHTSRDLKADGSEDGLDAIAYAIDGIAVIVNKTNEINDLSESQIKDIFTGKIKRWSEVGGKNSPITVVTREAGSGTRNAFADIIGLEQNANTMIVPNATTVNSTGAVQTNVSQNPNAIGYMSFSDVDINRVNTVLFGGVEISGDNLRNGTYTLMRTFYMITKKGEVLSEPSNRFIDFVLSADGQKVVEMLGLMPIRQEGIVKDDYSI